MSSLGKVATAVQKYLINNSSSILTAIGITGTVTTAVIVGKVSYSAGYEIRDQEIKENVIFDSKEVAKKIWKNYIPAAVSGAATIASILGSSKLQSRRTAALTAAYSISEKALSEYRDKIAETIGEKKEKLIRDEIAKDKISNNPPKPDFIVTNGSVLCCELYTGRYFSSDIETLRKAQNEINSKMLREMTATLSDFYYMINLPNTSFAGTIGWDSDKLLELHFTTILSEDGKPCVAFDYNYVKAN